MGPAWLTGRKTERSQAAGWKLKIFFLSFFFFQPPPSKKKYSLYFGFVTFFPWGTFHDGKVTGAFLSPPSFPELFPPLYSLSPHPCLVLYFCIACRMSGNVFFLSGYNNISSFLLGFFSERNSNGGLIFTALNNQIFVKRKGASWLLSILKLAS